MITIRPAFDHVRASLPDRGRGRPVVSRFPFSEVPVPRSKSTAQHDGKVPALSRGKNRLPEHIVTHSIIGKTGTGIPVIGDIPWGTHICVFYDTAEDLLNTAASYFEVGLQTNQFCVWAISDPVTEIDAKKALRLNVPNFDRQLATGQIEILSARDWYLEEDRLSVERIVGGWSKKLQDALAKGYDGMRISGNAFWMQTDHWKAFCEYERQLDQSLSGQKLIALCTYQLGASSAADVLDVAHAHQCSIARRNGGWEWLETPELKQAKLEIKRLNSALDVLSKPFSGHKSLTPRELVTLVQIVRGASTKEAALALGVSPRTIEFHRANVMQKLRAKNTADLVRKVLSQ
jgi:DNA-binding CsgD family transcriptional regulator